MNKYLRQIELVEKAIVTTHPDPFLYYDKDEFYKDFTLLKSKEISSYKELMYGLAKIISKIHDLHTQVLFPGIDKIPFVIEYRSGDFNIIDDLTSDASQYVGKKITMINNKLINDVINEISLCLSFEDENTKVIKLEKYLLNKQLLVISNIIEPDNFYITLDDGSSINMNDYRKNICKINNKYILKSYEKDENTYFIKYSTCDDTKCNVSEFIECIKKDLLNKKYKKIVIDLQNNDGGSSKYFTDLYSFFLENYCEAEFEVLTNKRVFSSGMWAYEQMKNLKARFIGENPASRIDHFGNIVKIPVEQENGVFYVTISQCYIKKDGKEYKMIYKDEYDRKFYTETIL